MRPLKIVGTIVAALIVLIVLAVVALFLIVNPDAYRGRIAQTVEHETGRSFAISGPLSLKLIPHLAIAINDAQLGNPPGYGTEPFLMLKHATIGAQLWPLLHRQLAVGHVVIEGLAVHLVSRNANENNWRDLTATKSTRPQAAGGAGPGLAAASVAGVDVTDSSLTYTDEAAHSETSIGNLALHTGAVGGAAPIPVKLDFDYGSGATAAKHVSISARVTLPPGGSQVKLDDLAARYGDLRVHGEAAIVNLATMALQFDLEAGDIDLDRLMAPAAGTRAALAPAAAHPAPVQLPVAALRKLDAQGKLKVGRLIAHRLVFTGVTLPIAARDGDVRLGTLEAGLAGGQCRADIGLDARGLPAHLAVNAHVAGIDVASLLQTLAGSARASGRATADVNVAGAGDTDVALKDSLSGRWSAAITGGAVNGIDLNYELQRAQALLKRQVPAARSGPERTAFQTLTASGTLARGVVHNDRLRATTDYLDAKGSGTFTLATDAVDYHLTAQVLNLPASSNALAQLGGAAIPIDITGRLGALSVRPDLAQLAKTQLRREVNRRLDEQKGRLKERLGEKLQQLLTH